MAAKVISVINELALEGSKVQVVDYRWNSGERIDECYSDYILCYRTHPEIVSITPASDTRSKAGFGQLEFFLAGMDVKSHPALRPERTNSILFRFSREWFDQLCGTSILSTLNASKRKELLDMKDWRIEQSIRRIGAEVMTPGFATPVLAEALAAQIGIDLARHFNSDPDRFRLQSCSGQISFRDVNLIQEYVESCENEFPKVDDIAKLLKISSAHLRRLFKHTTGKTLHNFISEIRIRRAKSMLEATDLPLKEISYRLGFSDQSTFSYTFNRYMHLSPSEYRQAKRN